MAEVQVPAYCYQCVAGPDVLNVPALFLISATSGGSGLLLALTVLFERQAAAHTQLVWLAIGAGALSSAAWMVYVTAGDQVVRAATARLRSAQSLVLVLIAGHALPVLLLLLIARWPEAPTLIMAIAGVLLAAGASAQKAAIVLERGTRGLSPWHWEPGQLAGNVACS